MTDCELTMEQKIAFWRMRYEYLVSRRARIEQDIENARDNLAELGVQP